MLYMALINIHYIIVHIWIIKLIFEWYIKYICAESVHEIPKRCKRKLMS